jgi:hypothetical protein
VLPKRSSKRRISKGDGLLDPQELRRIARGHYNEGKTQQALGCARLAHAIRRYFRQQDINDEMLSLLDSLYYLRRCLIKNQSASYRLLDHILCHDIIPVLESYPILSPTVEFMLLQEMGAILNELGAYRSGAEILKYTKKQAASEKVPIANSRFRSGVFRQYAFCLICSRENRTSLPSILDQALDSDDSNHNRIGVANANALFHLASGDPKKALDTVSPLIIEVKKGMRLPGHPEIIGCSYENYLSLLSNIIIALAQLEEHSLIGALEEYKNEEILCNASVRLTWPDHLRSQMSRIGSNITLLGDFLSSHMTWMVRPDIVKNCEIVARLVMKI